MRFIELLTIKKYNPYRVPAGSPKGGQFTSKHGAGNAMNVSFNDIYYLNSKNHVSDYNKVLGYIAKGKIDNQVAKASAGIFYRACKKGINDPRGQKIKTQNGRFDHIIGNHHDMHKKHETLNILDTVRKPDQIRITTDRKGNTPN